MTPKELLLYFSTEKDQAAGVVSQGVQAKAAKALGVSRVAVSQWMQGGEIPFNRQCEIEVITKAKLKADQNMVKLRAKTFKAV